MPASPEVDIKCPICDMGHIYATITPEIPASQFSPGEPASCDTWDSECDCQDWLENAIDKLPKDEQKVGRKLLDWYFKEVEKRAFAKADGKED